MASDIKIQLDDFFFTATRVWGCLCISCKFNNMNHSSLCELKMIEVDEDGRCKMMEKKKDGLGPYEP